MAHIQTSGGARALVAVTLLGGVGACSADDGAESRRASDTAPSASVTTTATTEPPLIDIVIPPPAPVIDPNAQICTVNEDPDDFSLAVCELSAGAESFEPVVEWFWDGGDGWGPPLVANLTDDNGDGVVDLCDTPDVVVVAGSDTVPLTTLLGVIDVPQPHLYVLDGATGTVIHRSDRTMMPQSTPALGDIDHDGEIEIVAVTLDMSTFPPSGALVIFNRDLTIQTEKPFELGNVADIAGSFGVSLADIDGDGQVELLNGNAVFDILGNPRWATGIFGILFGGLSMNTIAADLDGNGNLEVLTGPIAVRPDATVMFDITLQLQGFLNIADKIGFHTVVANLDDDPSPEIVTAGASGLFVLEHDGAVKHMYTSGNHGLDLGDFAPPTVHDFDGDGEPEIGIGARNGFTVFEKDLTILWSHPFATDTALTGATAFDFLGDGVAEAIYADQENLLIFDGLTGDVVMSVPRVGELDYPVVVDVDNDGHAEIVSTSKEGPGLHTVQVIGDSQNLWIPTRRIWNQRQYHVTNVLEDGTIPQLERNSWERLNTYRTNVQLEAGGVCAPPPPLIQ